MKKFILLGAMTIMMLFATACTENRTIIYIRDNTAYYTNSNLESFRFELYETMSVEDVEKMVAIKTFPTNVLVDVGFSKIKLIKICE